MIKKFLKIDPNFKVTITIFNKLKINYWICQGTLLGIVRDQSLIPWDPDIDLAVMDKQFNKDLIEKIMKKNGFSKKKKFFKFDNLMTFQKRGGRDVDINYYKLNNRRNLVQTEWYLPKNIVMRFVEVLSFSKKYNGRGKLIIRCLSCLEPLFKVIKKILIKKGMFYKKGGYSHPRRFIDKFKQIKFFDLNIIVPFFYLEYLKYTYGKSWRKPKKNYSWVKDSPSTRI